MNKKKPSIEKEEIKQTEVEKEIVEEKNSQEEVHSESSVEENKESKACLFYEKVNFENEQECFDKINENQKEFNLYYSKIKRINTIVMIAIMVIVINIFIFGKDNPSFIGIAIALMVLYFIFMVVYSRKTKDKLNNSSLNVIKEYFINLDSFITRDEVFSDIQFNFEEKLPEDAFKDLKICKDIIHVAGRDLIKGKICDHDFIAGDNLIKTREKKEDGTEQDFVVFLGKLFVIDLPLLKEGRALIYLKGKSANGPTDLEGLEQKDNLLSEKFVVYANTDISKIINKMKKNLERFEISDLLLDMFISIDNSKIGFGFSYVDSVMSVPLLDKMKLEDFEQYIKDVGIMVDVIKDLDK